MQFNGRGFYNTLVFSSSQAHHPWQIDDYKKYSLQELFEKLKTLDIPLNPALFKSYAETATSPEDLADILSSVDEGEPLYEQAYLLIFELWQRLCPHKQSLSLFCDQLDRLIHSYQQELPVADELIKALDELSKIFENFLIQGLSTEEAQEVLASYLSYNLDHFLYEFFSDLIESGEMTLAFELIYALYDTCQDKLGLDLLKATINLIEDPQGSTTLFSNTIDRLFEANKEALILDAIYFTYDHGLICDAQHLAHKLLAELEPSKKQEILVLLEPLKEKLKLLL
jgi:hypothetical protein